MTGQWTNGEWQGQPEARCPSGDWGPHSQMAQWSQSPGTDCPWVPGPVPCSGEQPPHTHRAMGSDRKRSRPHGLRRRDFNQSRNLKDTWEETVLQGPGDDKIILVPNSTFQTHRLTPAQGRGPCRCDRKPEPLQ